MINNFEIFSVVSLIFSLIFSIMCLYYMWSDDFRMTAFGILTVMFLLITVGSLILAGIYP